MNRPQVLYTTGYGFRWYFIGTFVDAVRLYPRVEDWIEVIW